MLIPNHPDGERLSALAFHDADATADAPLVEHVASCTRCTELIDELGALRASLAELPDVAPPRPLRLLPQVEASSPDRFGAWVRRAFGPVMAVGAALVLVGTVGTVAPSLQSASGGGDALQGEASDAEVAAERVSEAPEAEGAAGFSSDPQWRPDTVGGGADDGEVTAEPTDEMNLFGADAERSPWPMVLFTGVALLIGAALLRWILAPRAG